MFKGIVLLIEWRSVWDNCSDEIFFQDDGSDDNLLPQECQELCLKKTEWPLKLGEELDSS